MDTVSEGATILPAVWAMWRKRQISTGKVYKWKARLNLDGSKQIKGVHYWETSSEAVKTRFGRNSEFFSQTKWVFAQNYELHSSYLLENVINTCKASFF